MHYSRVMPPTSDHRYFTSTAVLLNEVLKLALSTTFAIYEVSRNLAPQTPVTVLFEQIYRSVFSGDGWKLAIPATLYPLENTLQYVALGNMDPVHFQILYQLKVCRRGSRFQHRTERRRYWERCNLDTPPRWALFVGTGMWIWNNRELPGTISSKREAGFIGVVEREHPDQRQSLRTVDPSSSPSHDVVSPVVCALSHDS